MGDDVSDRSSRLDALLNRLLTRSARPTKPFSRTVCAFASLALLLCAASLLARTSPVAIKVRHLEGMTHGFLLVRDANGQLIGTGDYAELVSGSKVTDQLTLHFRDGSVQEETTHFSQHKIFRLLDHHLIQKGPIFKTPTDLYLDGLTGNVAVHYTDSDGTEKAAADHIKPSLDLANGMIPTLLENLPPGQTQVTLSYLVATPKPRLIALAISLVGEDSFFVGPSERKALHYVAKVELGGVAGVVAPIIGKQPPDTQIWILKDDAPVFVKSQGPPAEGEAVWTIELTGPAWRKDER